MIKPDDALQDFPDGASCWTDEQSAPAGFGLDQEMNNKFIRGATNGGDGGGFSISTTHFHTTGPHFHNIQAHEHATNNAANGSIQEIFEGIINDRDYLNTAHHMQFLQSGGSGTSMTASPTSDAVDNLPEYVRLLGIKNISGGQKTPTNIILGYVGTEASIPERWELVSSTTDKQIYATTTAGEVGDVGGENMHDHELPHNHRPTLPHNHDETITNTGTLFQCDNGITAVTDVVIHDHDWTVADDRRQRSSTDDPGTDSVDKRGEWTSMIFVKKVVNPTVHIKGGHIKGATIL